MGGAILKKISLGQKRLHEGSIEKLPEVSAARARTIHRRPACLEEKQRRVVKNKASVGQSRAMPGATPTQHCWPVPKRAGEGCLRGNEECLSLACPELPILAAELHRNTEEARALGAAEVLKSRKNPRDTNNECLEGASSKSDVACLPSRSNSQRAGHRKHPRSRANTAGTAHVPVVAIHRVLFWATWRHHRLGENPGEPLAV